MLTKQKKLINGKVRYSILIVHTNIYSTSSVENQHWIINFVTLNIKIFKRL